MGLQEALYGVGTLVLLAALVYAALRAGRRPRRGRATEAAAEKATRRNFDKA